MYKVQPGYIAPYLRQRGTRKIIKRTPSGRIIIQNYNGQKMVTLHATRGWRSWLPITPSTAPHLMLMTRLT